MYILYITLPTTLPPPCVHRSAQSYSLSLEIAAQTVLPELIDGSRCTDCSPRIPGATLPTLANTFLFYSPWCTPSILPSTLRTTRRLHGGTEVPDGRPVAQSSGISWVGRELTYEAQRGVRESKKLHSDHSGRKENKEERLDRRMVSRRYIGSEMVL